MPLGTRVCYYPCWTCFDVFLVEFLWCWNWMIWLGTNSIYISFVAFSFLPQEPGSCSDDYPLQRMWLPFHDMHIYLTNTERSESSLLLLNIVHMLPGKKKDNGWSMNYESMDSCPQCSSYSVIFPAGGRSCFSSVVLFTNETIKEVSKNLCEAFCYWNNYGFHNICE